MQNTVRFCPYCMHVFTDPATEKKTEDLREDTVRNTGRSYDRKNIFIEKNAVCPFCSRSAAGYTPSPQHLFPGTILRGRYLLGFILGEGGHGITYVGYDLVLEIRVAVKEFFPLECCTRNAAGGLNVILLTGMQGEYYKHGMMKFLREARILAKMEKQQVIVGVRDYFEENRTAYIVMEYIEGETFADIVKKQGGRMPQEELFRITKPLLYALDSLHKNGIIHRDLCPDNLMLEREDAQETKGSDNGNIRLLDFGCARDTVSLKNTLTLTLRHGYAPIEQYQQNGGQGPWTDIYALCATFYYCLTGVTPPVSTNRITDNTLAAPSTLGVEIPPFRERALMKGLRIRPHRRFASMKQLMEELYRE